MIIDNTCNMGEDVFNKEACDVQRLKLLCITSPREDVSYQKQVELACLGGADMIQLRDKNLSKQALLKIARELQEICSSFKVVFTLNDDTEIAKEAGCDGVHIGLHDMPYAQTRKILPFSVVGVSAKTVEEAMSIEKAGASEPADYLGFGPIFSSYGKEGPEPLGLEGLKAISSRIKIPIVAIGGINTGNVKEVIEAGAHGVAVIRAVCGAKDIKGEAKKLKEAILKAEQK